MRPNLLSLTLTETGSKLGEPVKLEMSEMVSGAMLNMIEDLERIQNVTATPFAVPQDFTAQNVSQIRQAARLISGETAEIKVNDLTATFVPDEGLYDWVTDDGPQQLLTEVRTTSWA